MPTETVGDNTGDDHAGTDSTYGEAANPTTNHNGDSLAMYDWDGTEKYACWVKYPGLSGISGPVTVSSCAHDFWRVSGEGASTGDIDVHRLLVDFIDSQANWNDRVTSTAWPGSGGGRTLGTDMATLLTETMTVGTGTGAYQTFGSAQLAADVEDFINGDESNFGWGYLPQQTAWWNNFRRDNWEGQGHFLTVTYAEGPADVHFPIRGR